KAWVPVIIPLLVQLFRRADTLALAMEARCYVVSSDLASGAHPARTRLRTLSLRGIDYAIMGGSALAALAIMVLPRFLSS
ncbi:MAG: energy-coupling factor transporter transmembrane protein EcfT, partial [Coriobacteriia bacterium]|nr:energy-coupling factor transporter transmembrane protein EcfT [Coriobacteriia bacterium]MCL2537737.1 energy-coupling factor transporter transmembrane protein EcfT [Coriobacteriia bacterium]